MHAASPCERATLSGNPVSSSRKNPEKAKRAAAHPERPGQVCKAAPASFMPVVDRGRCEGKADCVEVCPYDVFEVGRIDETNPAHCR